MPETKVLDNDYTTGMVALIPSKDSIDDLLVDGGDPAEQLHLTVLYLGEMDMYDEDERTAFLELVQENLPGVVKGKAFAHASFNPNDEERDPCSTYLISDVSPSVQRFSEAIEDESKHEDPFWPWIPHITAGFGLDFNKLEYTGPVTFDKIRVTFGPNQTDFDLEDE